MECRHHVVAPPDSAQPAFLAAAPFAVGAETSYGPVIENNGPVIAPPEGSWNLDKSVHYKVSMDIADTPEFPGDINNKLVSAARFLNMHAQTGVPEENIDFTIVVHGKAGKDFLSDAAHKARYGEVNPNTELLGELQEAGVTIYVCSQSALFAGMPPEDFNPAVTFAVFGDDRPRTPAAGGVYADPLLSLSPY